METKVEKDFKAVDFMRKVREEMSNLYKTDKENYFKEIREAMTRFKAQRQKLASKKNDAGKA